MKFLPKTEEQLQEELNSTRQPLLPEGRYSFKVSKAEDTVSKKGNPMIKLTLNVTDDNNRSYIIRDYLMEQISYKLKHCADACGLAEKYRSGELVGSDFKGKEGLLFLRIEEDKTGQYPDKNAVKDYIVERRGFVQNHTDLPVAEQKHATDKGNAFVSDSLDDNIPF